MFAYSTNAYTRTDLADAIRRIAGLGYEGIEILLDTPHLFPPTSSDQDVDDVRQALDAAGLRVSNTNGNTARGYFDDPPDEGVFEPSLNHPDPAVRQRRIDCALRGLEIAAALGSPAMSTSSGKCHPTTPPERAFDLLVESLKPIMERAEALGVNVGIEAEPALLVETTVEVMEVAERVGSDRLGLNFDLGHAAVMGEDLVARAAAVAHRTWNVHVEDIRAGKHWHHVPGDGDLDLAAALTALRAAGYSGAFTVELYTYVEDPDLAGRRALEHLLGLGLDR